MTREVDWGTCGSMTQEVDWGTCDMLYDKDCSFSGLGSRCNPWNAFTAGWHQRTRCVLISPSCSGPPYLEASFSVYTIRHFWFWIRNGIMKGGCGGAKGLVNVEAILDCFCWLRALFDRKPLVWWWVVRRCSLVPRLVSKVTYLDFCLSGMTSQWPSLT